MKKYLLIFGLAILSTACSRDNKSCNCYEQKFERIEILNELGRTDSDTGWQSVGSKKEYSKNCDDNKKIFNRTENAEAYLSGKRKITYSETRIECN